jgi:DNA-binding response OmpR family regulator
MAQYDGSKRLRRILIVDDDPSIAEELAEFLGRYGFETILAVNGKDALTQLEMHPIDAVLTDVLMPEMDGLELAQALRDRWAHVKVIATTQGGTLGYDYLRDVIRHFKVDTTLMKPIDPGALLRALNMPQNAKRH